MAKYRILRWTIRDLPYEYTFFDGGDVQRFRLRIGSFRTGLDPGSTHALAVVWLPAQVRRGLRL